MSDGKLDDAVSCLHQHGCPIDEASLARDLAKLVLSRRATQEGTVHDATVLCLRQVLQPLKAAPGIQSVLMATHYTHMLALCRAGGRELMELRAKVAVTLLRYNSLIPNDKLFYQAGMACKAAGQPNLAFVLLNRYVDLTEAIEEGDASMLENSDFSAATAVPFTDILPTQQYLPSEVTQLI